jgi:hypothetical protein
MWHTLRLFGRIVRVFVCASCLWFASARPFTLDDDHSHQDRYDPDDTLVAYQIPSGTASFSGPKVKFADSYKMGME